MPPIYTITYLRTGEQFEWVGGRGYYYEIDSAVVLDLSPALAWCNGCTKFVDAEWIRTVEEYEQELVEILDPNSMRCLAFKESHSYDTLELVARRKMLLARAAANMKRKIEWRRSRQSPPKCLECGSTKIIIDLDETEIPNVGKVKVGGMAFASTYFLNWYYTAEGDRIPRDAKPTYWHHPAMDEKDD